MELLGVSYKIEDVVVGRVEKVWNSLGVELQFPQNSSGVHPYSSGLGRVVTKISSCGVNITIRQGIKQLGNSIGFIFLLCSFKSMPGEIPGPCLLMTALGRPSFFRGRTHISYLLLMEAFRGECKFFHLKG